MSKTARMRTPGNALKDFTADLALVRLALLASVIGVMSTAMSLFLQRLIGLFTNLFYYQRFQIPSHLVSPADHHLGAWAILIPVAGGAIVGLMARYGSEKIRGHGIPEAIEAILIGQSRMQPMVAVLKPLSSAIAIGSGGPFGAEGPIIVTGGACGSILAQVFHLTSAERKTLLVAGAAAGMSATFGTPLAAVLLAVELLLFEWKPRSLVPVAIASALAAWLRPYFGLGLAPLIHVVPHTVHPSAYTMVSASLAGLVSGAFAVLISNVLYAVEDGFHRLPIHWSWWPAMGGLCVGLGGYFQPHALGIGFDVIDQVLLGQFVVSMLFGLLLVKMTIWAIALGSGTSGGILAPLLMMGAVLGAAASGVLPGGDRTLWPLVCMAAVMGGSMRAPLTSVAFALELTHDIGALIPLLIASSISYALALLVMRRSILTEKIARRGFHVTHEYGIDPLERLSVGEVMAATVVTVPATLPVKRLVWEYFLGTRPHKHQGYPVVGSKGELVGVITRSDLLDDWTLAVLEGGPDTDVGASSIITFDLVNRDAVTAFTWESSRTAAERMALHNVGRLPVLADDGTRRVVGMITRSDLLKSRARLATEENRRERFLGIGASSRS